MGPLAVAVCVSFSLRKCVLEVQNRRFFLDFSLARAYRRSQDWDTRGEAREKRCRFGMPEEVMKKMLNWVMRVSARKMSLEWAMTRLQLLPPILAQWGGGRENPHARLHDIMTRV